MAKAAVKAKKEETSADNGQGAGADYDAKDRKSVV